MNSINFLRSRLGSFKYAFKGLWSLLKDEHNSRILSGGYCCNCHGFILKINTDEWSAADNRDRYWFLTELLKHLPGKLADLVDPEWMKWVSKAKDYAAAAVLVSAVISVVVGGLILFQKLWLYFNSRHLIPYKAEPGGLLLPWCYYLHNFDEMHNNEKIIFLVFVVFYTLKGNAQITLLLLRTGASTNSKFVKVENLTAGITIT